MIEKQEEEDVLYLRQFIDLDGKIAADIIRI
ncbi:MAG: hypothetical protein ACI90V_014102 [Bacillariaceae sp.]|jgi:hypothetical protein